MFEQSENFIELNYQLINLLSNRDTIHINIDTML